MYQLTEQELDQICDSGNMKTLDLGLFTLCAGVLATLLVTIKTVTITDAVIHAAFIAAILVFALGTLTFGVRGLLAWQQTKQTMQRLKRS